MAETYDFSESELLDMHQRMRRLLDGADVLLRNLLHWTKTHIEGQESVYETINLKKVLTGLVDMFQETIKHKGNSISIEEVGNHEIESDKNRIEFILRNLIANANKFTSEGQLTVKTASTPGSVMISIRDTGIGIENDRIDKILGWGSRQNTDGTSGEKGFGFGLPMCKEFVESLDGKITVQSKVGEGTEVIVEVPIAKSIA
jgi:signal transduction histidine kinase